MKQQTSLQTFNNDPLRIMSNRPSPTDSATWYEPHTYKEGNDGNMYTISVTNTGAHRWIKANGNNFIPIEIKSPRHPAFNIAANSTYGAHINSQYKFKVGDRVRVVQPGLGVGPEEINTEVIVIETGYYSGLPGYKVSPAIGNSQQYSNGHYYGYDGFIGEETFELVQQPITTKPINMAKSTKTITKKTTQEVRQIETSLINKEEVFKMLALAEATGLPLLLVGEPGVAKTKTIIEYAKAWLNKDGKMTAEDFQNKMYILETDEGTKASEIKGMPDLGKLFTENKYELNAPVAEADIVIINEVDKASSAIRNAMLGVMNEKFLFNGKSKIPCKWKLFIATCNEIPKDEQDSPFWDRFMLKMTVNRVSAGDMSKYYAKGARNYKESFKIGIPSVAELDTVEIPSNKLDKYLEVGYQHSSDRTLTFVPKLAKAVSYVWDISVDKALVKTAQIMISQAAGSELQNKLMSPEIKAVMSKVEMLHSHSNNEALELAVAEIESLINAYTTRGVMDEGQVEEIEMSMQYILQGHPARADYQTSEEFDNMIEEVVAESNPF
jgi:MoxR-like ATPase